MDNFKTELTNLLKPYKSNKMKHVNWFYLYHKKNNKLETCPDALTFLFDLCREYNIYVLQYYIDDVFIIGCLPVYASTILNDIVANNNDIVKINNDVILAMLNSEKLIPVTKIKNHHIMNNIMPYDDLVNDLKNIDDADLLIYIHPYIDVYGIKLIKALKFE